MARIRTIKPEFWSHPVMSRQSDSVKCMAIALLNFSDDEGYFLAEPALVRSFARPLDDDSTIARSCIDTLVSIGWIEIRNHDSHGKIGVVLGFKDHQSIDRPKVSHLKQYYELSTSKNDRRTIDEQSSLEQGTGNREQGSTSPTPSAQGKRTRIENLGEYPKELPQALSEWRSLLKSLQNPEILESFPPGDRFLPTGPGTSEATWRAWQKRKAALVQGHKVSDQDVLDAVRICAKSKFKLAQDHRKLAAPMLPTLINSDGFVDALVHVVKQRVIAETEVLLAT